MPLPRSSRPSPLRRRFTEQGAAYRLRLLLGVAVSLALVTAAFRVPWAGGPGAVGWGNRAEDRIEVAFEEAEPDDGLAGHYRTAVVEEAAPAVADEADAPPEAVTPEAALEEPAPPPEELAKLDPRGPILEFAERSPELPGGLGTLYLHIDYPPAAIEAGIQGRLVLQFVVEPDGTPIHIEVVQPLHPLCDSAAVRALRAVTFEPGRQNGEAARVRMRLPVRFQLLTPSGAPVPDSALAGAG